MDISAFKDRHRLLIEETHKNLMALSQTCLPFDVSDEQAKNNESRVGGPVSWGGGEPLPLDGSGNPMFMAIQIDCADFTGLPDFPNSGLLQIFLASDVHERGITFDREYLEKGDFPLHNGDGFQVVYHPRKSGLVETSYLVAPTKFPVNEGDIIKRPRKITFHSIQEILPVGSHWQATLLFDAVQSLGDPDDFYIIQEMLSKEFGDYPLYGPSEFYCWGGHASPMQLDQRLHFEEYRQYDRCLLNFGEMTGIDIPSLTLAILIRTKDLKSHKFDDVVLIASSD